MATVLPDGVWERFAAQFLRATGLQLSLLGGDGTPLSPSAPRSAACPGFREGDDGACARSYRKAVQQALASGDATLFRCPRGLLVFAVPVDERREVLVGGPALGRALDAAGERELAENLGGDAAAAVAFLRRLPVIAPRSLLEKGQLAGLCLRSVIQGHQIKEDFTRRQRQVMTLFEVSSDLARAGTEHEFHALALNIVGVLFDVECAALLFREPGGAFRVHTAMGSLERVLRSWAPPAAATDALQEEAAPGEVIQVAEAHLLGKLGLPEEVERVLLLPLGGANGADGLLALVNAELEPPALQMLKGFALQVSLVREKQRLQGEIAERTRELQAVQETSRQFLGCLEPEQLFGAVLEEARKITGAGKGSLMVATNGDGELAVKAVHGMTGSVVSKLRVRAGQGVAGRVFATGDPIVVQDVERDARFGRKNRPRYATRSFASVPIAVDGRVVGVLNLSDKVDGAIFDEEDLRLLQSVATQATLAMERSTYYAQSQELRRISITDSLTGLLNRRYFQERLAEEVDRSVRHHKPLSLMMIDVDHFKRFNDENGHPAGDKALIMVARCLREGVRTIDVVSRFGGEEFAVILPETPKGEAAEIGERLRADVEAVYFPGEELMPGGSLTVSLGVAGFPDDAQDLKSLIQRADRALYQAKARGRNCIVPYRAPAAAAASPPPPPESGPDDLPEGWTRLL